MDFSSLPHDAQSHLQLLCHAATFRLLGLLKGSGLPEDRFPFLRGYREAARRFLPEQITWGEIDGWWERSVGEWASGGSDLPLARLDLPWPATIALSLALLPEEDSRFGDLYAALGQAGRLPSGELIARVVGGWAPIRDLLDRGLLVARNGDGPRSEWGLYVPPLIAGLLRGESFPVGLVGARPRGDGPQPEGHGLRFDGAQLRSHTSLPDWSDLPHLPAAARGLPALLAGGTRLFTLRGSEASDRETIAGAIARGMGRGLLLIEGAPPAELPVLLLAATLAHLLPVLRLDPAPGETLPLRLPIGYSGPFGLLLPIDGGVETAGLTGPVLHLPLPGPAIRRDLWAKALGDAADSAFLDLLSTRLRLAPGHIRQVAAQALLAAQLDGRQTVTMVDLRAGARNVGREHLETLALRIVTDGDSDALVLPDEPATKLQELALRCRHRDGLAGRLGPGFGSVGSPGVRALFAGPSGTGKTLAARVLAHQLGMELYRVEMASIVNKYIGETEKNLHRLLSRAEELDVVLLFDEGDGLLGRRSEIKSANDRYANLETNFLLQRLEGYGGIVLITTNAPDLIDPAFRRRIDVVIPFALPGEGERLAIWQKHLPVTHEIDPGLLQMLSARCALSGGQVRNATLHAALLSLEAGRPVMGADLLAGVESEYRKAGAISPLATFSPPAPSPIDLVAAAPQAGGRRRR